jgi:hypothetical protein
LNPILVKKLEIAKRMKIGSASKDRSIIFLNDLKIIIQLKYIMN